MFRSESGRRLWSFRETYLRNIQRIPQMSRGAGKGLSRNKRVGDQARKPLAKQSLAHYRNAVLETSASELAGILFKVRAHPSRFKAVARVITTSDTIDKAKMARSHLRRYWAADSAATTKSRMCALKKPTSPPLSRDAPPREWDLVSVLIFPERRGYFLLLE